MPFRVVLSSRAKAVHAIEGWLRFHPDYFEPESGWTVESRSRDDPRDDGYDLLPDLLTGLDGKHVRVTVEVLDDSHHDRRD